MGMGIGHHYLVHQLKYFCGELKDCIKFMQDNPPRNEYEWYELWPSVHVKQQTCTTYQCLLVEHEEQFKKRGFRNY